MADDKSSKNSRWFVDEVLPHEADLRAWLHARFSVIGDVDDLVQEAYSRLLKVHVSGPVVNPRAFLFVTARNLALNQIRHSKYERPAEAREVNPQSIVDEFIHPLDKLTRHEDIQHLIEAIQNLPKRCRQVMTLRKIYGFSQKEAANYLGISEHTVAAQGSIGLRKCIEYFRRQGYLTRYQR